MTPGLGPDGAPGILLVLDGWGHGAPGPGNALAEAATPTLDELRAKHPSTLVAAHGEAVGLLPGTVGNSEIGHLVIGAGRPLPYDSLLVQQRVDDGSLRTDAQLGTALVKLAERQGTLHLIGLCSDGQIHAHVDHLAPLLTAATDHRVARVLVHAITDGRDVSDGTAAQYLDRVRSTLTVAGVGVIASVVGRGYAMDKAGNLELTGVAVAAIADGRGTSVTSANEAVEASERGDEWVAPSVVGGHTIGADDLLLFFNFRSDRIQQLVDGLLEHLRGTGRPVAALSLAQYDSRNTVPALVARAETSGGLAEELAHHGVRSVRIAESEKFEHVTYYLNGRDATSRSVEEPLRILGADAPDYRARPEMNLGAVTDAVLEASARSEVGLIVANLANIDVVGHTGDHTATVRAAEHTDAAVERIIGAAARDGRWILLVGDHGNAEVMTKPGPDGIPRPYGGHTTNPVPLVLVPAPTGPQPARLPDGATLAAVAPTVLALLGLPVGAAMTGRPLL